jgi:hypothetical protein
MRKVGTALAMASTPVSAEQPEANARSNSSTPTVEVAEADGCVGAVAECARSSPMTMTAKIDTMTQAKKGEAL